MYISIGSIISHFFKRSNLVKIPECVERSADHKEVAEADEKVVQVPEKRLSSAHGKVLGPGRHSTVGCDAAEVAIKDVTSNCVEGNYAKDHQDRKPMEELEIEDDGAYFVKKACPDQRKPGKNIQHWHQKRNILFPVFLSYLNNTFPGVCEEAI